jgi:hypothetical protein
VQFADPDSIVASSLLSQRLCPGSAN